MAPPKKQIPGFIVLPAGVSILGIVLGLALMVFPAQIITLFPVVIGLALILAGVHHVGYSIAARRRTLDPGLTTARGILNIVVGLVFLLKGDVSLVFLSILFGIYALVSAGMDFTDATVRRRKKQKWLAGLIESIVEFVLGAVLLFAPFSDTFFWARFLGLYFILASCAALHVLFSSPRPPAKTHGSGADNACPGKKPEG